jgi:26S proteasome regulatory subunit N9
MENEKISDFLQEQRDEAPEDLQHFFLSFEDYWERKLWHELTDILVQFYAEPQSAKQRLPIYNNFIKSFADKINQLKLVRIGLSTANECKGVLATTIFNVTIH